MEHQDDLSANAQSGSIRGEGEPAMLKPRFAGLYREDVVQSAGQPGVMGMVTKVAGDSDSSSDSESDDDAESVAQGCARVCWTNLEESTEKIEDIRVVDRAFMHGDIVAAVSSPLGQIGTVVNVDLKVDLELPNGDILKGIDTRKIKRIRSFVVGDYVIHDHWLGRVDEVVDNVTVLFDDGSKCKVVRADPERLCPSPLSPMDDTDCPYYPGQRVRASSSALFKTARWLKGSWKANRMEGIVTDVEVGSVMVYWIAAAHTGYNSQPAAIPSEQQDPKHLQRMADLSHTNWQLGDRALLPQKLTRRGSVAVSVSVDVPHSECEENESSELAGYTHALEELGPTPASINKDSSSSESWIAYKRKLKKRISKHKKKAPKKDDLMETASLIVGTNSKVDVVWQDGTQERGVDACTLFPVDHLGDHDFWPEQHVMEKGADFEGPESESKRVGIVKSVDSKQRTAKVRWLLPSVNPEEGCRFESEEDVVSVYELIEHPDYSYSLGDVVIRLCSSASAPSEVNNPPVTETEAASSSNTDGKFDLGCEIEMENKTKVDPVNAPRRTKKVEDKATSADYSWVGVIIGLQDGEIKVAWADGQVSKVGPQAIFVVGRDEDDESSQTSEIGNIEEADDAGSWTTVDSATEVNEEQELGQLDWDENSGWEGHKEASRASEEVNSEGQEAHAMEGVSRGLGSALALPFAALIRVLRFAAGFIWTLRGSKRTLGSEQGPGSFGADSQVQASVSERQLDGANNEQLLTASMQMSQETSIVERVSIDEHEEGTSSELTDPNAAEITAISTDSTNTVPDEANMLADDEYAINDKATKEACPRSTELLGVFKQFDSVKDSLDHHFASEASQPSSQRRWSKKIQQEWIMLEKNLPDTIFVRVYEDRMDLMRAVIIGAAGTPYQDGLFFFDMHMPPDYPSVPPLVHYHSGGLRLNPNLYETGKVCLSLLNTWTGKGNEIWHPSTSSILQVLVSIQGLVLNANPYFNEAGYDRQIGTAEGEKNSLAYTENSFLLSCKSMLYVMRRPPKHFEEFVQEHFKQRGPYILQACKAYMEGYPVGCLLDDATASPSHGKDSEQTSSVGFKIMLSKIMPRLVTALKEIGANCEKFEMS